MKQINSLLVLMFLSLNTLIWAKNDLDFAVFLQSDSINNVEDGCYGSATIVSDGSKIYIVTAAHIAEQMDSLSYLFCSNKDDNTEKICLKELCDNLVWQYHDNADLAVLLIDKKGPYKSLLKYLSISSKILMKDRDDIMMGMGVKILGFPYCYGVGDDMRPFMYNTRIVNKVMSFPSLTYGMMCEFVPIQPCVKKGNVGGPAFYIEDKLINIFGFVQGTVYDKENNQEAVFDLVTPAYYFFEIVDKK